jgi:hypothetical protein
MKKIILGLALLLAAAMGWARPPQNADQNVPLGTLARKLQAKRTEAAKQDVKVFTNDNLPARPPAEGLTAASGISSSPSRTEPTPVVNSSQAAKPASGAPHGESYFREAKAKITARLEFHRRELAVLQQKLAQNDMQYYADPNKTLQQEYTRSDINKKTEEIKEKEQAIADDEKALADLQDQLRREGGDASWLR